MKRLVLLALSFCASLAAQFSDGPVTSPSGGPEPVAYTRLFFYDGSGNLQYICYAKAAQPVKAIAITSVSVSSNTATVTTTANHGLAVGNQVALSGSATSALNGSYVIATAPSATTFTVTTSGVTNGTYVDPALTSTAPESSQPVWAIQKFSYNGSNNMTLAQWAGGSTVLTQVCDNRATLAYQ